MGSWLYILVINRNHRKTKIIKSSMYYAKHTRYLRIYLTFYSCIHNSSIFISVRLTTLFLIKKKKRITSINNELKKKVSPNGRLSFYCVCIFKTRIRYFSFILFTRVLKLNSSRQTSHRRVIKQSYRSRCFRLTNG